MSLVNDIIFRTFLSDLSYATQTITRQIVLVMMLLCYHLWFQIDFACPCTTERNYIHCYSYMVLPCLLIASIIVWNDKRIGRIFRYSCYHSSVRQRRCHVKFCSELFLNVLQAASSGFLWCGFVLVDGDWYLCCGSPREIIPLCCKNESEIEAAELEEKVNLKNQSVIIGLICILLTTTSSLALMLPWSRWCRTRNYFRVKFEEIILEQTEKILMTELGKAAAGTVTKSLLSLSSTSKSAAPPDVKNTSENAGKKGKEKSLLYLNADWKQVAYIAGGVIESIPNSNNNNTETLCT